MYLTTLSWRLPFDYSCQFAGNEKMQMSVALRFLLMKEEQNKEAESEDWTAARGGRGGFIGFQDKLKL